MIVDMFNTLVLIIATYTGFILAYHYYGKPLGQRLFRLVVDAPTPAHVHQDGVDYVPSRKGIVFGHHFTSIAGTGQLPWWGYLGVVTGVNLVCYWVYFMGAVHDLGALVVSLRHDGRSICDIADELVSKRVRLLVFLLYVWLYGL